ncbi:hypothetical protein KZZ52_27845 [Dactylosporangium sp. AC04546]|uniref:hypothetical protein n=1 Tax=Dactylosporangium sp. AC04546 TaxID=2862460 RepID=UPI001EDDDF2E|nr:hypothetical protein [Dactylosporangium sp. AC04546]WVK89080.1 hypothetical protein KZZ52_27845 [Dactylosporangium sp. AC04546]
MRPSELSFADLDEFSDLVWRTAARHPSFDTAALAAFLQRPEALVRAEVDRLADLGLLRRAGNRWEPQDPLLVLEARHAARAAELDAERAAMAAERARLYGSGLFADYLAGRRRFGTHAGIQVYERDEIFARMADLTVRAEASIRFLMSGPPAPGFAGLPDLLAPAGGRGVEVSSVWTTAAVSGVQRRREGRGVPPMGRLLVAEHVPTRTIVWDSRAALIPLDDGDLDRGGVLVEAPALVAAVAGMVERVESAAGARPPQPAAGAGSGVLRRRRALLLLFDQGHDDARAARELRVSVRTVKRDVEHLYAEWGVTSRFALGAAAVRAGWLGRDGVSR